MNQIAQYHISRDPDLSLSVRGSVNGWNLLHSSQSAAATTSSPAGLLLTPQQVAAIPPLAATTGTAIPFVSLFDPLYDSLFAAFNAENYVAMNAAATAFLHQHPIAAPSSKDPATSLIHRFFRFKGRNSTASERLGLIEGLSQQDHAVWHRLARPRMDMAKAQALATAVAGIKPPQGVDLLGDLRADLAFATLDACHAAVPKAERKKQLGNGYVDHLLDMHVFLPHWVFELEICKTREGGNTAVTGLLGKRLERLERYKNRTATVTGAVVAGQGKDELNTTIEAGQGKDDDSAAGTLGHTATCDCKCDAPACAPIDPCCGEVRWYVTELLTLKDRNWCYKPSDIAYIENVAPYETRIRTHGFSRTVVETSEDETNTSREESLDHQVTNRFNLQQEMQNNMKASLDVDAKLHYGKAKGAYSFDLNTHGSLSKETAYREAREQVREQVEKATLKMQVQTRKLRTRTVTTEQTESNKHKFKNTTSTAAVAKYFWVTQEKRGQLFSHGPRLHVDLLIPSPAMLFQFMEKKKRDALAPKPPEGPPVAPRIKVSDEPKVTYRPLTPKDILRSTYVELAAEFGVTDCPEPPPLRPAISPISLSYKANAGAVSVEIPEGYVATSMTAESATWTGIGGVPVANGYIAFQFGGGLVKLGGINVTAITSSVISATGSASGMVSSYWATSGNSTLQVQINLTPVEPDITAWQNSVYALIMKKYAEVLEKYEAKYEDYLAALKAFNAEQDDKIKGRHPFACEEIMRTELKRSAIFMMCGEFDWPDVMNMDSELCHFPWPNRRKSDKATNEWYFFDRAFDWNLASFTFYDYFRNPLCKWIDTYEPDEPNFLFKAFLRAGYCRIMVPVSPGMKEDVEDYLATGGVWSDTGTWPLNPDDPRWISVTEEIKHSYDCYQQDREGYVEAFPDPVYDSFDSRIKVFTDRYWTIIPPGVDQDAINLDLDHQIYIDGIEYRIISIVADPNSANYNASTPNGMSWIMGLERTIAFEPFVDPGATTPVIKRYNWAVGAKYVGAPFHFELPTDLIWIGDQGNACLPCYPIDCVCEKAPEQLPAPNEGCQEDCNCEEKPNAEDE